MDALPATTRTHERRRTTLRQAVKWGGVVVTVLLLVVWISSGWYGGMRPVGTHRFAGLSMGQFVYIDASGVDGNFAVQLSPPTTTQFRMNWWFSGTSFAGASFFTVPLWFPTVIVLVATAYAWRADAESLRRARVGMCPACGYDRASLAASSVCPECGSAAESNTGG